MPEGLLRDWVDPSPVTPSDALRAVLGGSLLAAQILARRGLTDPADTRAFIDPGAYTPAPADALPGLTAACEQIEQAIRAGDKILVWGDFDVDGQTSTTLLVSALRGLGASVAYHIPVRARESHGVNWENLEPLLAGGVRLVLTCDTGISSNEPLERAEGRGARVVISDHHDLPEHLPRVCAITNPKLRAEPHPQSGLPGVGVAYLLAEALYQRAGRAEQANAFLDLAALGIVADLAEQRDDTRHLLQRGLAALRQTSRTGLRIMFELAALNPAFLTEEHIGFVLGPRMNALGRLDDANPIVEFLTTSDEDRARLLANHLEGLNARRRLLTAQVLSGALAQIEKDPRLLEESALVLAHPEWPAGVIGIVASELSERFNRPTVLLSAPLGQPARGSARSVEGVNITEAIAAQHRLLLGFGGHPMAAGLSLEAENLTAFRRGLSKSVERALGGMQARPTLALDGETRLPDLSLEMVSSLERLAPFGPGNPTPALLVRRLTILNASSIGRDGEHLRITVQDEQGNDQKVVWWRGAGWPLPEGVFDLACLARTSNYRGQSEVQVQWIDARPVEVEGVTLRSRTVSVIDQRGQAHPLPVLQQMLAETPAVVWGEGATGVTGATGVAGATGVTSATGVASATGVGDLPLRDRGSLTPSETLIIWTTPPGWSELQAVLESVKPRTVVVFGVDPGESDLEGFLKRLAGLAKYAITQGGRVSPTRLAAATAQREAAVRLGLQWLEQRGLLHAAFLPEGDVFLTSGDGPLGSGVELLKPLRALIEETAAYRRYFKTAEKENLFG
jgi:single-stranded-DNA-specific exonuclease